MKIFRVLKGLRLLEEILLIRGITNAYSAVLTASTINLETSTSYSLSLP